MLEHNYSYNLGFDECFVSEMLFENELLKKLLKSQMKPKAKEVNSIEYT